MANTQKKRPYSIRHDLDVGEMSIRFWVFDNIKEAPMPGFNLNVDGKRVNKALYPYAILDGIKDSIRDAGALGVEATLKQKFDAMRERAEYLTSGTDVWAQKGGGRAGENVHLLVRVLMQLEKYSKLNEADVFLLVSGWSPDKRKAMLETKQLRPIVERITAEQTKDVDTDELFAELNELG